MARRVLRVARAAALGLGVCSALCACKHEQPKPTPAARGSAPAPPASAIEITPEARFQAELKRAHERWQARPKLDGCSDISKEKSDAALCTAASNALETLAGLDPTTPAETALPVLADACLALTRLAERARFLSLEDLGQTRLEGDAGLGPAGAAKPGASASAKSWLPQKAPLAVRNVQRERPKLKLSESPRARLSIEAARLERDAIRSFGAYLEYAPLPVRRLAYERAKTMQAAHPHWPGLGRLLREASVLEADAALKQGLQDLAGSVLPRSKSPDQPIGSK